MHPLTGKQFSTSDAATLYEIICNRRDVRGNRFLDKPVEADILDQLLKAALHAPSVGFSQPWEFVLIRDRATKEGVKASYNQENEKALNHFQDEKAALYTQLKLEGIIEAPLNIAVYYKPSTQPVLGQTTMAEVGLYSVVCAIQNMWLMARALNIGIGWVSILDPQKVSQVLNAPPENRLVAYLCVGYTDGFFSSPELELLNWEKRKAAPSTIVHEKYPSSPPVNQ